MYYAVAKGKTPGIYTTWSECEKQVKGYPYAVFKKFHTEQEAMNFITKARTGKKEPTSQPIRGVVTSSFTRSGQASGDPTMFMTKSGKQFNSNIVGGASRAFDVQTSRSVHKPATKVMTSSNHDHLLVVAKRVGEQPEVQPKSIKDQLHDSTTCHWKKVTAPKRNLHTLPQPPPKLATNDAKPEQTGSESPITDPTATYKATKPRAEDMCLDHAVVYTDGACPSNGKHAKRAAIGVFWGDNDPRNLSEPLKGRPTNNRAEIHAAVRAILQAKEFGLKSLTIRTDSQFLIDSVSKWMNGWIRRGWTCADGRPVINREDFEALNAARKGIEVNFEKVPGHRGIYGNEMADRLANEGLAKYNY